MDEFFPLVTEEGDVIGKATRKECHSGSFLLHPVVHLHVFDKAGRLYLQKRSMDKDIQPGKWDTSVGGHIDYGETVEQALRREAREELGLTDFEPFFAFRYTFRSMVGISDKGVDLCLKGNGCCIDISLFGRFLADDGRRVDVQSELFDR